MMPTYEEDIAALCEKYGISEEEATELWELAERDANAEVESEEEEAQ